jgi:hypothetical protein
MRQVLSDDAVMIFVPCGLKDTCVRMRACACERGRVPVRARVFDCASLCHTATRAVTRGEGLTFEISPSCPTKIDWHAPVMVLYTRAVPSAATAPSEGQSLRHCTVACLRHCSSAIQSASRAPVRRRLRLRRPVGVGCPGAVPTGRGGFRVRSKCAVKNRHSTEATANAALCACACACTRGRPGAGRGGFGGVSTRRRHELGSRRVERDVEDLVIVPSAWRRRARERVRGLNRSARVRARVRVWICVYACVPGCACAVRTGASRCTGPS